MDSTLSALPVVYATRVEERHLDRFEHVNVMWYTHFFDEATLGIFERVGCGPSYYRESGYGMFALEQHTRYLSELRLGQALAARARVLGVTPKRIHFLLFLARSEGERSHLCATSELVGTHVELRSRRSAPFPGPVRQAIEQMLAEHRALPERAAVSGIMKA